MTPKSDKTGKNRIIKEPKLPVNKAKILGVGINSTSYDQVLKWIETKLSHNQKFFIATPNPEMLVAAQKDRAFMRLLNQADLSIPDGMGLVLASWFLGTHPRIKTTVTGTDLVEKIAKLAPQKNWRLFFLGGRPGIAQKAIQKLSALNPKFLSLCQSSPGPQQLSLKNGQLQIEDREVDSQTLVQINNFQPHLLFVAFGHGKQEHWITTHLPYLKIGGAIGVGGAFDYLSGQLPRAPFIVRKLGFEWVFRLISKPNRFRRIATAIIIFPLLIIREKLFGTSLK